MKPNSIRNIGRATIVAVIWSLVGGCTIAPNHSPESETFQQNQVSANDYANRCDEQTALFKHEIALCRSVPFITVPLQ
jgi:hypothetical protein